LDDVLHDYSARAQTRWAGWRRKQRLEDRLPPSFAEALGAVIAFADPALTTTVAGRHWDPATHSWT
jgi:hypothetical protein